MGKSPKANLPLKIRQFSAGFFYGWASRPRSAADCADGERTPPDLPPEQRRLAAAEFLAHLNETSGKKLAEIYAENESDIRTWAAENGYNPDNEGTRNQLIKAWAEATSYQAPRPGRFKQFIAKIRAWLREHGFFVHHLTDDDLAALLAAAARKSLGDFDAKAGRSEGARAAMGNEKSIERYEAFLKKRIADGKLKATANDLRAIKDFYLNFPLNKRIVNRWGEQIVFAPENLTSVEDYIQHFAVKRAGEVEKFSENHKQLFASLEDALTNPDERILTENEKGDRRICFTKHIEKNGNHFVVTAISENGHLLAWIHMDSSSSYVEKQRRNEKACVEKYGVVDKNGKKMNLTYEEYMRVKSDMPLYLATAQTNRNSFPQAENSDGTNNVTPTGEKSSGGTEILQNSDVSKSDTSDKSDISDGADAGSTDQNGAVRSDTENTGGGMASLNLYGEEFNDLVAIIRPYIGRGKLQSLEQYLEYLASKGIDVSENEAILLASEARRLNEAEAQRISRKRRNDWLYENNLIWKKVVDYAQSDDFLVEPDRKDDLSGTFWLNKKNRKSGKPVVSLERMAADIARTEGRDPIETKIPFFEFRALIPVRSGLYYLQSGIERKT